MKSQTEEDCRNAAKSKGYKAWGYRNHLHGTETIRNTCFFYDNNFKSFAENTQDTVHTTGCVNEGEKIEWNCEDKDPYYVPPKTDETKDDTPEYTPDELRDMYDDAKKDIDDDIQLANVYADRASSFDNLLLQDTQLFQDILAKRVNITKTKFEINALISEAETQDVTLNVPEYREMQSISLSQKVLDSLNTESINMAKEKVRKNIEFLQNYKNYFNS